MHCICRGMKNKIGRRVQLKFYNNWVQLVASKGSHIPQGDDPKILPVKARRAGIMMVLALGPTDSCASFSSLLSPPLQSISHHPRNSPNIQTVHFRSISWSHEKNKERKTLLFSPIAKSSERNNIFIQIVWLPLYMFEPDMEKPDAI